MPTLQLNQRSMTRLWQDNIRKRSSNATLRQNSQIRRLMKQPQARRSEQMDRRKVDNQLLDKVPNRMERSGKHSQRPNKDLKRTAITSSNQKRQINKTYRNKATEMDLKERKFVMQRSGLTRQMPITASTTMTLSPNLQLRRTRRTHHSLLQAALGHRRLMKQQDAGSVPTRDFARPMIHSNQERLCVRLALPYRLVWTLARQSSECSLRRIAICHDIRISDGASIFRI